MLLAIRYTITILLNTNPMILHIVQLNYIATESKILTYILEDTNIMIYNHH